MTSTWRLLLSRVNDVKTLPEHLSAGFVYLPPEEIIRIEAALRTSAGT